MLKDSCPHAVLESPFPTLALQQVDLLRTLKSKAQALRKLFARSAYAKFSDNTGILTFKTNINEFRILA